MDGIPKSADLIDGAADMRGRIATVGIEEAAEIVANAYAAPANAREWDRIKGIILATFEAGMLHQLNTSGGRGGRHRA